MQWLCCMGLHSLAAVVWISGTAAEAVRNSFTITEAFRTRNDKWNSLVHGWLVSWC